MRVTNNMIMKNASSNINSTKEIVNKRNTQMTTQKKIDKPSDDPVVAVRSLRLSTTLSQVSQYYSKNIPDATSWLDVTESSLINMRDATSSARTLAVNGSTGSLSQTDRKTILSQLESLQQEIFSEGNADYAGRTVFTGYRTDSPLTFTTNETDTSYTITQNLTAEDNMEEKRYYAGDVVAPTTEDELLNNEISDTVETTYYRLRLNYDGITAHDTSQTTYPAQGYYDYYEDSLSISFTPDIATFDPTTQVKVFENETDWANYCEGINGTLGKTVGDDEIVIIEETGDIIFGENIAQTVMTGDEDISVTYNKTGFEDGELRPEYYYNCIKTADPDDTHCPVTYTKFDDEGNTINFDIEYTVSTGQTIVINTEASNVFDSSIQRDLGEMLNAVTRSIKAHEKVDTLTDMKSDAQYASEEDQEKIAEWLDAAQKEADYADDDMKKLYNTELGKIDTYYAKINLAITDLGCKTDSLKLTKTRMSDQQETVEELQSENDDVDLSQIIIDYTAAYTAYQASLTAASKLGSVTLLNYL